MRLLSYIGYKRDNGQPETMWKRIGKLLYDDKGVCKILLYGFRQGLCVAKPREQENIPFLQGDIVQPVDTYKGETVNLFVGFISTAENKKGETQYAIKLDCSPFVRFQEPAGIWFDVKLEDGGGYEHHTDNW